MTLDWLADSSRPATETVALASGAVVLRGLVGENEAVVLWQAVQTVIAESPPRCLSTPNGKKMSVALTNCGAFGWHSDRRGYRYEREDPLTGRPWPAMPPGFLDLAGKAAAVAGYSGFVPDACIVNRYLPGARMGLHQDKDEADCSQPIVSVSLGLPAVFAFGGLRRSSPTVKVWLLHGDVVVWGGPSRLCFHGVLPVKDGWHPSLGRQRVNLTLRKAG